MVIHSYKIGGISVVAKDVVQTLFFVNLRFCGAAKRVNALNYGFDTSYFACHRKVAFGLLNTFRVDCFPVNAC